MSAPADRPWRESLLAMLGISLVLMLSALDQTVIGNALPSIVADLHGFELYAWVATGYLLASVVTIPIFGRLGDYYGRKPFVLVAAAVFTLASLLCAAAPSMLWLVIGRGAQGVGGGILIGTAFACVPELFPDTRQRLRWQMLLSAAFSVVNAAGPTLGGVLTETWGWRAVFYLNLPLGAVAFFCVWRYLPHFKPPQRLHGRLDWPGALLIALALGGLQLFVEWLPHADMALASLAIGSLALAAFAGLWWWERRIADPLLPPALFHDPALRCLFVLSVLSGAVMFVLLFYLPLLFQGGYGYSPKEAGLLITPLVLCITLGAIVNGRIVARLVNPNRLPQIGFALLLLTCLGLAACGRHASFGWMLALMFSGGLGFGFIFMNLTLFTQTLAARAHLGIATALLQSLRLVGGLLGTAIAGSLVSGLYRSAVTGLFSVHGAQAHVQAFSDPRLLLDAQARLVPLRQMAAAGHDAAMLLDGARDALVRSIDIGIGGCAVLALLALWHLRRLPTVDLHTATPRA
ncbi:MFS transporter [Variovorax ginsengisoli]|uniref:EmrB/QacA subfamily drug resistance transporter n=1 Tax=Variovorax ginsengisoli TaxID=363844 RepID=A0ABT9SBV2_9BURK|nr:MFS transporter [Variovorax ginsengisoli]MDP9900872.1 EmrB/QacA subfamily drug resistance transporter [Variovorax ginsengisoli]